MSGYGQFCPVAKAMELLDERWTILVIRELMLGSRNFSTLQRGLPRMSPTLLSARLRTLARAGVVERHQDGNRISYTLTPAGQELRPIVEALGQWGVRWIPELGDQDLDPHLLLWDIRRTVPLDQWPRSRTVVRFEFTDQPSGTAQWWLCVNGDDADVCDYDPGFDVTATVVTTLSTMVRLRRVDRTWEDALRTGDARIDAPSDVRRAVPAWLGQMSLGVVPHPIRA